MREIEISEIQILPLKPRNGLVAFASFILNDSFFIGNVAVHSRPDGSGYRLVYPVMTLRNGRSLPVAHPINKEIAILLEELISIKYEELILGGDCRTSERSL